MRRPVDAEPPVEIEAPRALHVELDFRRHCDPARVFLMAGEAISRNGFALAGS